MADAKGDALVAEAEKKLKSWSLFNSNKTEVAAECYDRAAAQYKLAKEWSKAGDAYVKVAELNEKMGQSHDAVTAYTNAAKAFKNDSPPAIKDAVKMYRIAVDLHSEANRFSSAAKIYKEIALMEQKDGTTEGAIKAWQDAADMFKAEDQTASCTTCLKEVAELSIKNQDYTRAIEVWEEIITTSLESAILTHSCKDYMFKAGLCAFVLASKKEDMEFVTRKLDRYEDMHPAFGNDRNCLLLRNCVKAFEEDDLDAFTDFIWKYDRISPLPHHVAAMLHDIQKVLKSTEVAGTGDSGFNLEAKANAGGDDWQQSGGGDDWQNEEKSGGGGDDDFLA